MFGFFINIILIALAFFELAWGISLMCKERNSSKSWKFLPSIIFFSVIVCAGYGLMGIIPDVSKAYIPRFFGLWGCVGLLITEFSYIVFDLNTPRVPLIISTGFASLWGFLDLAAYGGKDVLNYIRNDFYNTMEVAKHSVHVFHYIFLSFIGAALIILSVKWYKSKRTKRERRSIVRIIIANYIVLFATLPDIFSKNNSSIYSTASFCIALSINFFMWISAIQQKFVFSMSTKNVSQEIFDSIDVPIIIFSETGEISLYNPSAQEFLGINVAQKVSIRDVFQISDVEQMRLLNKAKHGEDYLLKFTDNNNEKTYILKSSVKLDYAGEPYCIIGTILPNTQELNNEERNI